MAMALLKGIWESGSLVFRRRDTLAGVFTIAPQGVREWKTVSDIDAQNGTITAAIIATGILVHTSTTGGGTLTFDTAANIVAAFPGMAAGEVVKLYIINDGDQTVTLAQDGGNTTTIADTGQTIAINESCLCLILMVSSTAVKVFTIGA